MTASLPATASSTSRVGISSISPPIPPERGVAISIHDVSPLTWETTREILQRLERLGAHHFSLLVVPDHHFQGHFLDSPTFCDWLRERASLGDEIVIHGYFHQRDKRKGDDFLTRVTNRFYTAGEGEFYDIPGAHALRLISMALSEFRTLGLCPTGFIAPAWLLSEQAEAALRKLGLEHTTRLTRLYDLREDIDHPSQSLVWSVRSAWRRAVSRVWNRTLAYRLRHNPFLRIGIHPVDLRHQAIWRQIEHLTQRALADRTPVTYQEWIDNRRTLRAACPPK